MPRQALKSDRFYRLIRAIGRFTFFCTAKPTVLHAERSDLDGAWLLAANHTSPYDVAPIVAHCRRIVDWVSITEVFAVPFLRWFCGNMGAFPINRAIKDLKGARVIYQRLKLGRVVGIFPEGEIREGEGKRVLDGGDIRSGVGKIAYGAKVPIVPCVVVETRNMRGVFVWLPLRLIRYGIIFGTPLQIDRSLSKPAAIAQVETELVEAWRTLDAELMAVYHHADPAAIPS